MRKDAPIISCFHLAVGARGTQESHNLLDDLTLEIPAGSWNEVVGDTGSGKSLLFGILSLRFEADGGKLLFGGRNFDRLSRRGIADLRRTIASCGQRPLLLERRTVLENLVLPFVVRGDERNVVDTCEELLGEVGLADKRDVPVAALSHEERLIVGAIRAIAPAPKLLLVDGVLEELSEAPRRHVMRLMQKRHLDGATVILFGRNESQNARRGNVIRMQQGRLESFTTAQPHERVPETAGRVA